MNTLKVVGSICASVLLSFGSISIVSADEGGKRFRIGGVQIAPSMGLVIEKDDNLYAQPSNQLEATLTEYNPGFILSADGSKVDFTLEYDYFFGQYSGSGEGRDSSVNDYSDHDFRVSTGLQLSRRNYMEITSAFESDHDYKAIDDVGFTPEADPDEFEVTRFGLSHAFGRDNAKGQIVFSVDYYDKEYTNNLLLNSEKSRDSIELGVAFYLRSGPRSDFLLEYIYEKLNYSNDPQVISNAPDTLDNERDKYLVGIKWDLGAKTSGTAKVGYNTKKFKDADREDFSGVSWELGLDWSASDRSLFSLSTAREDVESNDGVTGGYIDSRYAQLDWQYRWTDRLSTILSTGIQKDDYIDDVRDRDETLNNYDFQIDYRFSRWFKGGISASYIDNISSIDSLEYERTLVRLLLEAGF